MFEIKGRIKPEMRGRGRGGGVLTLECFLDDDGKIEGELFI